MKVLSAFVIFTFLLAVSGCTTGHSVEKNIIQDIEKKEIHEEFKKMKNLSNTFKDKIDNVVYVDETAKTETEIKKDKEKENTKNNAKSLNPESCNSIKCPDSVIKCIDNEESFCENFCVDNVCTDCKPDCRNHRCGNNVCDTEESLTSCPEDCDTCHDIVCVNNQKTCPDSFIASCENTCSNGDCSDCEPDCTDHKFISTNIFFTQVFYDTPGKDSIEEWIEIYNPTDNTIDLKSWTISDNSKSWTFPEITVQSNSYLIIARDLEGFRSLYSCDPDIDSFTRSLNNNGDYLILKDNEDNEIDFVAWESGDKEYPEWDLIAGNNKSIKRINNQDTDKPSDWSSNQEPEPRC